MSDERNRVCPVAMAGSLDNKIRRWLQNPQKILKPYIKEGMTALDMGCGPGFFTIDIARLVGITGKVIAADIQEGMLQKVDQKIRGSELEKIITLHKCDREKIGISEKVDFILTFYMLHEAPDLEELLKELKTILNENGQYLLVEPKFFHVTKKAFKGTLSIAEKIGFRVIEEPKILGSWAALLANN